MNLFPVREETIVSPHSQDEVINRLKSLTTPPVLSKKDQDPKAVFVGQIFEKSFRLSLKINAPENFLPIVYGIVDKTSMGSIVFLKFKLFFSSLMFLIFWSSICLLACIFLLLIAKEITYGFLALFIGLLNYAVTMFTFNRKVKESHKALMNSLKID